MKKLLTAVLALLFALPLAAATTRNDDSCDIAQLPAATLLLPFFEVDISSPRTSALTTLVTVTNTVRTPQIAHITLWTDLGYPVVDWNAYLTGYDVYSFDLRDAMDGALISTRASTTPGGRSASANPKFLGSASANCNTLPGVVPPSIVNDIRSAFTVGRSSLCGTKRVGNEHTNAIGYATIDVIATCTTTLPTDPQYASQLLFDNVLTGESIIVNPNHTTGNFAGGNPLVHIRAIPEGGSAGESIDTNLPATFYGAYMPVTNPRLDRRQPLPARFVARFMEGGGAGFFTNVLLWRAGEPVHTCDDPARNRALIARDVVRFDEHENPSSFAADAHAEFAGTSRNDTRGSQFPPQVGGDVIGWIYIDLNTQGWATMLMSAEGRYMATQDATALGNGCSLPPTSAKPIGPSR